MDNWDNTCLPPQARQFLKKYLDRRILDTQEVEWFIREQGETLCRVTCEVSLGQSLIQANLLTPFQLEKILVEGGAGLVLGNYRLLEILGSGGMGTVYAAEHCWLKRLAALKVLPVDENCLPTLRRRFYQEMTVLAEFDHPNVVRAFDAGQMPPQSDFGEVIYLAMELVDGDDLHAYVRQNGTCSIAEACEYARQAACGLQAAHDRHLIHRDVKPSNLLRSRSGQVKLVDFGLVRIFCSQLTDPRSLLGSVEFMAPEQSHDPSAIGKTVDIYGLGASLFWLLTGEAPYPFAASITAALKALRDDPPRNPRSLRPDVPEELDALVQRMLARDPGQRPGCPLEVMNALTPFVQERQWSAEARRRQPASPFQKADTRVSQKPRLALVIDDEESIRRLNLTLLHNLGCEGMEASNGEEGLALALEHPVDLVVLDINMPGLNGYEVCTLLREQHSNPNMKILMVSGEGDQNSLADTLGCGADDYIPKPFHATQFLAKVENLFRLKDAQDRVQLLADQLHESNQQLWRSLEARTADLRGLQDAILHALVSVTKFCPQETRGHLRRLQAYTRILAQEAAFLPDWRGTIDAQFLDHLDRCVPLHDVGMVALPDSLLNKQGPLTDEERTLVQTHTIVGDRILESLARHHGHSLEFISMARAIVRHHHERFDGKGYPDGLGGTSIPAAARMVHLTHVYDALRSTRPHREPLSHAQAVEVILRRSRGQFDPTLCEVFARCQERFDEVFRENPD